MIKNINKTTNCQKYNIIKSNKNKKNKNKDLKKIKLDYNKKNIQKYKKYNLI